MEIEKYIPQAEKIFLGEGTFKDDRNERIDFIKNLETCDLLAVPGSGKTTALIAKLYCMAQNMPFEDGSGILVLAHTNNAVDEIEKKLKKHCPHLFEYPNFVGTIQSFVNRYLANQACFEKYGSYIRKNEDDLTIEKISKKVYYDKSSKINSLLGRNLRDKYSELKVDFLENYELEDKKSILSKFKELDFIDKNNQLKSIKENYKRLTSNILSQEEKKIIFDFNNYIKKYEPSLQEYQDLIKKLSITKKMNALIPKYFHGKRN
jgi:DNA helicase-2/ATP-dependent DNA helicase PcrA